MFVERWIRYNTSRLKLHPTKTEVLWLGSSQQLSQISIIDIPLQSTTIRVGEFARDLGVIIDSKLSLSAHVAALCRTGFYHLGLRQLRPMLRSLTHEAARTLIQAFISSRLDYCNSLLYGVSDNLIRRVQSIQYAAARLLTGAGWRTRSYLAVFAAVALASCTETRDMVASSGSSEKPSSGVLDGLNSSDRLIRLSDTS